MKTINPVVLEDSRVRLEPLNDSHVVGLIKAARDGGLWDLWFTSVPRADETPAYVAAARAGQEAGHMLPWAVLNRQGGEVVGTTRFHDIVPAVGRVEVGYTWYARSWQRTFVNTSCKLLLLNHAFEDLEAGCVGLRTDAFNLSSQRAIERLGARKDGVLRHHQQRSDGSIRDTVMYSIVRAEWPDVKRHLEARLSRG